MAPKVVIQLVEELKDVMPVGEICRHLGVGRSSYYRWRKNANQLTLREIRDQQIGDLCKQHKFRYGYRKISALSPGVCEKTVQRIMQKKWLAVSSEGEETEAYRAASIHRTEFIVT